MRACVVCVARLALSIVSACQRARARALTGEIPGVIFDGKGPQVLVSIPGLICFLFFFCFVFVLFVCLYCLLPFIHAIVCIAIKIRHLIDTEGFVGRNYVLVRVLPAYTWFFFARFFFCFVLLLERLFIERMNARQIASHRNSATTYTKCDRITFTCIR